VTVPAIPGGAETIVVSDGTNSVSTPFSITPKVSFATTYANNYGFPTESLTGSTITASGFGSGESLTFATTAFTSASFTGSSTCTTGTTPGGSSTTGAGSCVTASATFVVADTTGGAKSITATGATSGLTQSTTYTIKPWAAFYNSASGATTFSFIGTAPTSLLIEAHGLPAGTIAASSITIGGVATSHAAVTVGASGTFGVGAGNQLVVSPTANVPFGLVSAVIGGTTFNYAAGNIALGTQPWGGALISSIQGSGVSTGVASTDANSYKPGTVTASKTNPAPMQNQIGLFGYGFVPNNSCTGGPGGAAISATVPSGLAYVSAPAFNAGNGGLGGASGTAIPDCNGAIFGTALLGETPWSLTATPTTAASFAPTFTEAGTHPANVLSPSFGITPWIGTITTTSLDYLGTTQVNVHGFGATDVITATIGGSSFVTGGAGYGTCTAVNGFCLTVSGTVPDLAGGKQNVAATGSVTGIVMTSTGAVTYSPRIDNTGGTSLNIVSGVGGTTTILRTGTNFGVHGLTASTAYSIVWNAIGGSVTVGTFTSTATGGIPVPGVQVTLPADISGIHIFDIQASSTLGTSAIFGNTLSTFGDFSDSDSGLGATYATQYGDMLFNEGTSLVATPTVANVGGTTSITGAGLSSSTLYDLGISMAGIGTSTTPSTCSIGSSPLAAAPNVIVGSFTSTSAGAVPSGISVAINDQPTFTAPSTTSNTEQGTLYCVFAQTGPNFGSSTAVGVAEFELQASANLNMTSAPTGHNVILSAHGLNAGAAYNILFNPQTANSGVISGTIVGAILSNSLGAGSATITVPNAASGSYPIELQRIGTTTIDALANPPTLTVGGVSGTCTNEGTACMGVSGTPSVSKSGGNTLITVSYTNNSNAPQTAYIYGVVHNALGQTVAYTTATVSPAAGASQTGQLVLFGLAPGTYSVTLFAVSTSGTALSTTTNVSVTV